MEKNTWAADLDVSQITQVMQNLILNADQAMPGGGKIAIRVANNWITENDKPPESTLVAGAYVKISVENEGTGISPDILDKISDPYFTTKNTGTGLGLASTFIIIQQHGGL